MNGIGLTSSCLIRYNEKYFDLDACKQAYANYPSLTKIPALNCSFQYLIPDSIDISPKLNYEKTLEYLEKHARNYSIIKQNYEVIKRKSRSNETLIKKLVKLYATIIYPLPHSTLYKRSFPLLSLSHDTICLSMEYSQIFTDKEDLDFYKYIFDNLTCAYRNRIVSHYSTIPFLSFKDDEILEVEECILDSTVNSPSYRGYTSQNKHVTLQFGRKASQSTCMSMLLSDYLQRYISPDRINLNEADLSNRRTVFKKIEIEYNVQITTEIIYGLQNIKSLETIRNSLIEQGSAYIKIDDPEFMPRFIVIDKITDSGIQIRDPFHGWAITITRSAFSLIYKSQPSITLFRIISSPEAI